MWDKFIDDWKAHAEYIDREAAIKAGENADCAVIADYAESCKADYLREIIKSVPAADVVPVVRCRNCKYFNHGRMECENEAVSTDHEGGAQYSLNFWLDDFCSGGERKDRGADDD